MTAFGGNRTSGSINISPALLAHPGSGYKGDFESETFLVQETAHTLRGEGFDASEDGTGRGTPLVPVAYAVRTANTSANGHGISPELAHTLDQSQGQCVAFDCKASGMAGFGVGGIASTMRAMGHAGSHSNGGGHLAVAFNYKQANTAHDMTPALGCGAGGGIGDGMSVMHAMQVRRLTPTECERLQGFPDNYTAIPWRGRPASQCPDGPRYKALGNSWAVPVVRWIGERIFANLLLAQVQAQEARK